jgi:gamma-glutamyltranspeptidase
MACGHLWAVLGTPGADNQMQVNLQVLTVRREIIATSMALSSDTVMVDGGRPATSFSRPALQAVDGAPSRTMTVHGRRLVTVDTVISRRTLTAMIDLDADPRTAIELPRWTSRQPGQGANWPHEGNGALTIESDAGEDVIAGLLRRGHVVKPVGHLEGPCAMQAIRVLPNGVRMAASDTRRDGWAGAY